MGLEERFGTNKPRGPWWHEDSQGRRIGYMWPEDFLAIIDSIWGRRQGIKNFALYISANRTTVEQWANGKAPIPKRVALLVELMQREVIVRNPRHDTPINPWKKLPTIDANWLPGNEPKKGLARNPFA